MLKIKNLNVYYGGIHALRGVDIEVNKGEIVSIIGSNGAGKSTLLNAISGIVKPSEGDIEYMGKPLPKAVNKIVKAGISQVPEGRLVFTNLTVEDNIIMGAYLRKDKKKIKEDIEQVYQLFPRLKERITQLAGTLSGGEQQMLAIARGLMAKPELLLLDEPSLGLAPLIVQEIFEIIKKIRDQGTTILLVEQNAYQALKIADYGYILENGKIVLDGQCRELWENEEVKHSYLGK